MHSAELGGETGDGSADVVLVHGLGMSGRYMMPTAVVLAATRKVHVPDLPGFGKSGKPPRALTIPGLADALGEWMAARGIISPILLGNSLGAQVIVDFASRHPARLAAAVLVGPTIDPRARRISSQIWRLAKDIPREPAGLYGIALSDYFRAGFGRCLETLRHALADPVTDKFPAIRVPVLVMRGERDPLVPQIWVEQVAESIPEARWVTLKGVAHAAVFSAPEVLVEEMRGLGCRDRSANAGTRFGDDVGSSTVG